MPSGLAPHDVFTPREIARAAGAAEAEVRELVGCGAIRTCGPGGGYVARAEAVRAGRLLVSRRTAEASTPADLFSLGPSGEPPARGPFAASGVAHAALVVTIVAATTLGLGKATMLADEQEAATTSEVVFLALPGPGGGGGGGGARETLPPPKAERKGASALSSPLPARKAPPEPVAAERPNDPEPPREEPLPPIEAPVEAAPSDAQTQAGVLEQTEARTESRGPGAGGGVGSGDGTGLGAGDGNGIGDGSGGGAGGGPYRPGSGVEPPVLLREVRPDYTEQARLAHVEGDLVMEVVVGRDGVVGDVRVVHGLGYGLDERAVQAVRRWRFSPARRHGATVDVRVQVAMEFRIR
jgi:TonB family protein